jgi:hypothetical protein
LNGLTCCGGKRERVPCSIPNYGTSRLLRNAETLSRRVTEELPASGAQSVLDLAPSAEIDVFGSFNPSPFAE